MLVLWGRGHFEKGPLPHAPPQKKALCVRGTCVYPVQAMRKKLLCPGR